MSSIRNKLAAPLLGLGLLGGGFFAVDAAAGPSSAPAITQATPGASPAATDQQCVDEQNDDNGQEEANEAEDDVQEANGVDNVAEGETDNNGDDELGENGEDDAEDNRNDEQEENGADQESTAATPGTLTEGQDLLPQTKITVEQAITTAQGAAIGNVGTVELEDRKSTLVFEVTVGDQAITVDASTGTVASIEPVRNTENECEDDAVVAPGTLTEGQDLLPRARITVEQAITTARVVAIGNVGAVALDQDGGTLVFNVAIGNQEVTVDAATGEVLSAAQAS